MQFQRATISAVVLVLIVPLVAGIVSTRPKTLAAKGVNQGDVIAASGSPGETQTKACCFPSSTPYSCVDLDPSQCSGRGGWPRENQPACLGDSNDNDVDNARQITPTMGQITDQCDEQSEGGEQFCRFIRLHADHAAGNTISNEYSVDVTNCTVINGCDHVYFKITDRHGTIFASTTDSNSGTDSIYTATFDTMANLPKAGTYTITASAHPVHPGVGDQTAEETAEEANPPSTNESFEVRQPPLWYNNSVLGSQGYVADVNVTWDPDAGEGGTYTFRGRVPNGDWADLDHPLYIPLFGDVDNKGQLSVQVTEVYDVEPEVAETRSAEGGIDVTILGATLVDEPFDINVMPRTYQVEWDSDVVWEDSVTVYEGTMAKGVVDAVYYEINLTIDFGMSVCFHVCSDLGEDLKFNPVCLAPDLNPWITFDAALDLYTGVASFGIIGKPELNFVYPFCYDYTSEPQLYTSAFVSFDMNVWSYICCGWGFACWDSPKWRPPGLPQDWPIDDDDDYLCWPNNVPPLSCDRSSRSAGRPGSTSLQPATHSQDSREADWLREWRTGVDELPDRMMLASTRGPFVSPRIASDGAGNAIVVWIHDSNRDTANPNPDVYYSYLNNVFDTWSPPEPVATTDFFESDPRVIFVEPALGANPATALLVVTQNQMVQTDANGAGHLKDVLAQQELVWYEFEPIPDGPPTSDDPAGTWTYGGKVTDDSAGTMLADGRSELVSHPHPWERSHAYLVWVRDPDQALGDLKCNNGLNDGEECTSDADCEDGQCLQKTRCNTEIMVSKWDHTNNWVPMVSLGCTDTDDDACCAEPDIALDTEGNAMAVWVRDEDGDPNTGDDRVIEVAYHAAGDAYNAWSTPVVAVDSSTDPALNLRGMLWPSAAFDYEGRPAIAFTSRSGIDNGGLMPSDDEYGEGAHDFPFLATGPPSAQPTSPEPFTEVQPIGGLYETPVRWPKLAMAGNAAVLGYRSFKGIGSDGFDGEPGVAIAPIKSAFERGTSLPWKLQSPDAQDDLLDWEVDMDLDASASLLRIVWVKPSSYDVNALFGAGYDGLQLRQMEIDLDLTDPTRYAACCLPDFMCWDANTDTLGDACDPTSPACPGAEEECTECVTLNRLECDEAEGYWLAGLNIPTEMEPVVVCDFNPCDTGSCCTEPGVCEDDVLGDPMTLDDCVSLGGDYVGNALCDYPTPPCPICEIAGTDNCQLPDLTVDDLASMSDRNAPPNGVISADDFVATQSQIQTVCAWGVYLSSDPATSENGCDCNDDVTDDFRVRVYNDAGGHLGTMVGESSVSAIFKFEGPVSGGLRLDFAETQVYEYQLTLVTPIGGMTVGNTYWVEITNNTININDPTDTNCVWHWVNTSNTTNNYSMAGNNDGYLNPGGGRFGRSADMAFCLDQDIDPPDDVTGACCDCETSTCSYGTLAACDAGTGQGIWVRNAEDCESVTCADLTSPINDACENAISITGNNFIATDTGCATTDGEAHGSLGMGRDTWYAWTVGCDGQVVVSMCGTGNDANAYDSALGVYYDANDPTHCPCPLDPGFTRIGTIQMMDEGCNAVNDAGAGIIFASPQAAENCLMIRVGGYNAAGGRGMLEVQCQETECFVSSQPVPETLDLEFNPPSQKVRYVSFGAGDEGMSQAVRVTFVDLPAPYDTWNGVKLYVQEPQVYCENAGVSQVTPCPEQVGGLPQNWFWAARLGCDPHLADWTQYGTVHVFDEGIIPNGDYDLQVIEQGCMQILGWETDPAVWSPIVRWTQSTWGDLVQDCSTNPCSAPDDSAGIVDVTAILDKWKNLPGNVMKVRADIEGSPAGDHRVPDRQINITDVTYCLGAFLGDQYPGPGFPPPSPPPVCP